MLFFYYTKPLHTVLPSNGNMEAQTSNNRMSATPCLSLYLVNMSLDYCGNHNSLAEVENFGSYIITYCIFWTFISLLILPICAHFRIKLTDFGQHYNYLETFTAYGIFHTSFPSFHWTLLCNKGM